jgi:radical SAM protein with 4Fe4S-binding SPASM domain
LHCQHCYQDPKFIKKELKTKEVFFLLEEFVKQIKGWRLPQESVRISLTGGEPFLRNDFFEILQKCYKNREKFSYGVLTNGTFLTKENVKKLKELKVSYVQVSLEGLERVNDRIRGKGVFKKVVEGVNLLKKEEVPVNLSMTLSRVNLSDVFGVIKLSKELKVSLGIRRLVPFGTGQMLKKYILEPEELRKIWKIILRIKKNYWNRIGLGCEDGILTQDYYNYVPGDCSAGYASFTIMPNGDVYPCRRLPIFLGNLAKKSFEQIYSRSKKMQKLRDINNVNDVCYSCPFFESCHGGAKCQAFSYFGDETAPDPQCWRLFKKLPESKLKWRNSFSQRSQKLNSKWCKKIDNF